MSAEQPNPDPTQYFGRPPVAPARISRPPVSYELPKPPQQNVSLRVMGYTDNSATQEVPLVVSAQDHKDHEDLGPVGYEDSDLLGGLGFAAPAETPAAAHKGGLATQLAVVRRNAFGGYHDFSRAEIGEGVLTDRQAVTEEKFAQNLAGKAYGGLVGKLARQQIVVPDDEGKHQQESLFNTENIGEIAENYRKIGTQGGDNSYEEWRELVIGGATHDAYFPSAAAKAGKEKALRKILDDIKRRRLFDTPESTQGLVDAFKSYQAAGGDVAQVKEWYRDNNSRLKRYSVNAGKAIIDTLAAPGRLATNLYVRAATRVATANPAEVAKKRGILRTASIVGAVAFLGWRIGKGFGADHFLEGLLPFGDTGMAAPSSSNSPTTVESAVAAISTPSPSASASPSVGTHPNGNPVIEHLPTGKKLEHAVGLHEGKLGGTGGFESDLGEYKHDNSGKYGDTTWEGTLEWKAHEIAEKQGIHLTTEAEVREATDRLQEALGVSDAKAQGLSNNYHIKLTQGQVHQIFDGLGEHTTPDVDTGKVDTQGGATSATEGHDQPGGDKGQGQGLPVETSTTANPTITPTPEITPSTTEPATNLALKAGAVIMAAAAAGGVGAALIARNNKRRKKNKKSVEATKATTPSRPPEDDDTEDAEDQEPAISID